MTLYALISASPLVNFCPQDIDDPLAAWRQACVARINEYRDTVGLHPLQRWCGAGPCLDAEAADDAARDQAHASMGRCNERAQNECPNHPDPVQSNTEACLAQMWAEGPGDDYATHGHYINMTQPAYTAVECGLYQSNGRFWAVQNFR